MGVGASLTRALGVAASTLLLAACGTSTPSTAVDPSMMAQFQSLSPEKLPPPPADVTNRFADSPVAAKLGKRFFYDPSFSGRLLDGDDDGSAGTLGKSGAPGRVACAGCHVPSTGFVDTRSPGQQISLAAGWGLRKAPSLLDVGQDKLLTWDGRRDTLFNQVFSPLESPVEMNSSRLYVAEQLARNYRADYEAIFGPMPAFDDPSRFPALAPNLTGCQPKYGAPLPACDGTFHGSPGDQAEYDSLDAQDRRAVDQAVVNFGKALGAYERLLACGPSRFDRYVHGENAALTLSEQRGAALFVGKAGCAKCHSGPYFSDQKFHNVGLGPKPVGVVFADLDDRGASAAMAAAMADPLNSHGVFSDGDDGRLPAALPPNLDAAFKTPMLRCVSRRPSFMHTAQVRTLAQVVAFFVRGGDGPGMIGANELTPLPLTDEDSQDLVNFLLALDGPGADSSLVQAQ